MIQMGGVPEEFEDKLNELQSKLNRHVDDYNKNKEIIDSQIESFNPKLDSLK